MVAIKKEVLFIVVGADMHNKELAYLAMHEDKETAENIAKDRLQNSELLKSRLVDIQHVYTFELINSIDATHESFDKLEKWLIETVKLTPPQACTAIAVFGAKFLSVHEEIQNELID